MKQIKKTIDENIVNVIEANAYEVEARESVIARMLSSNYDTTTEAFADYQSELTKFKIKFEVAKAEVQKQYVDSIPGAINWTLDYASCELTINVRD